MRRATHLLQTEMVWVDSSWNSEFWTVLKPQTSERSQNSSSKLTRGQACSSNPTVLGGQLPSSQTAPPASAAAPGNAMRCSVFRGSFASLSVPRTTWPRSKSSFTLVRWKEPGEVADRVGSKDASFRNTWECFLGKPGCKPALGT